VGHDSRNYPFPECPDRILTPFCLFFPQWPVSKLPGCAIIFSIGFDKFISCEKLLFPGA
jgi:hypothetical protein